MIVVLRLYDGEPYAGLVGENVVGALPLLAARRHLSADEDAPIGERNLFSHLKKNVPPGADQRGRDELRADITLTEAFLVQLFQGFAASPPDEYLGEGKLRSRIRRRRSAGIISCGGGYFN